VEPEVASILSGPWRVLLVFAVSSACTVGLILRRPYLWVRVRQRRLRIETYFLGALLGPALILALGLLPAPILLHGLEGTDGLRPLGILSLFLSMVFISIFLDITGVFECCARVALRWAGASGRRLFFAVYAVVSVLTVFTSNDIIILTFTPLVYYFARHARLNPVPYLVAEFFAANTWSMLLTIGNPTNIVLAGAFHLTFLGYTAWMLLPTVAAGAVNLAGLYWIFRREIDRPLAHHAVGPPRDAITDGPGAAMGLALLGLCVAALALAPRLGLEMWAIALAAALGLLGVLVARRSWARWLGRDLAVHGGTGVRHTLSRMPWGMVPFVLSLFITVAALQQVGITPAIGRAVREWGIDSPAGLVALFGAGSALTANLLNNLPMTLAFAAIIRELPALSQMAAAFATVAGANLGANLTPLGALAGLMWMGILRDKEVRLRFVDFVRYGLLVTPASLAAALGVLALQVAWMAP
jgi:arsenical pump membrane protein